MTTSLHVVATGPADAPVLVLLHSIATHSALWSTQAPIWSEHFRVLAVDLPGHGGSAPDPNVCSLNSYARLIGSVLDRHEIERCAIVGLSLGGLIGQAFALQFPQRLSALVLANTSARTPQVMRDRWEERRQQALSTGMDSQVSATLERWFTPEFTSQRPLTVQWVANMTCTTHPEGYRTAIEAIQSADLLDRLSAIRAAVLLVSGGRDVATTPEIMDAMADRLPRARRQTLPDASHMSCISHPLDFAEHVGQFLSQNP